MIFDVLVFVAGLCVGSFASALSWRYPKRISIVKGRSFCPNCKHQIAWYDNIPLLSFLILGGKCRNCKKPISWRYPTIELATALGFLGLYTTFKGASLQGVYSINYLLMYLLIFLILELIFIIDLEHQIIPDVFIFIGIIVAVISYQLSVFNGLFAGFFAASLLMFIHLATRGRGMGLGDVKFAVLGGIIVGLKLMPVWLFLAFLTGGTVGIILIIGKKAGLKDKIAFGPFLVIAIPMALIWGQKILMSLFLQ